MNNMNFGFMTPIQSLAILTDAELRKLLAEVLEEHRSGDFKQGRSFKNDLADEFVRDYCLLQVFPSAIDPTKKSALWNKIQEILGEISTPVPEPLCPSSNTSEGTLQLLREEMVRSGPENFWKLVQEVFPDAKASESEATENDDPLRLARYEKDGKTFYYYVNVETGETRLNGLEEVLSAHRMGVPMKRIVGGAEMLMHEMAIKDGFTPYLALGTGQLLFLIQHRLNQVFSTMNQAVSTPLVT